MFENSYTEALVDSRALVLPTAVNEHLIKLAAAYYPREMCGVLTGRKTATEFKVNNFHWIPNISEEPDQWDYLMDPQAYFDAVMPVFANKNIDLVGIYHTHPKSLPYPSKMDIDSALKSGENVPYLIYAPQGGFRAWMLKEEQQQIRVITR